MSLTAIGLGASHPRLLAAVQWGGLFAGAWFAWTYVVAPKLAHGTPGPLLAEALLDVLFVWACCSLISFLIHLATSLADFSEIVRAAFWAGCDAVWFAPAILLLSAFSPAPIAVSIVLVVNTTRLLVARSMRQDYLMLAERESQRALFVIPELESPCFSWTCLPALLGAFGAQAGMVSLWKGYALLGAIFFAASAANLTAYSIGAGIYQPKDRSQTPRSIWNILATLILATALCSGGLKLALSLSPPTAIPAGPLASTRMALTLALHHTAGKDTAGKAAGGPNVTRVYVPAAAVTAVGGAYSGVVLRQKVKRQPEAILPMPVHDGVFGESMTHAMVIPFTGVYWVFRPPAARPPPDATVREGTPLESAFSTTDGAPIRMVAHQRLNPPVDIRCCDKIKVYFANAEISPDVLYAGMTLLNTLAGASTTESLAVLNTPLSAKHGTFEFAITRPTALRKFNEIEVSFYLNWQGSDRSPKVGLERFVLVPR